MPENVQTKNWIGTDADDYFVIDNINYDGVSNYSNSISGGLGNDTFEVNLDGGRGNYFKGEEGNDTYILKGGNDITVNETTSDSDGDDVVYIRGNITQSSISLGDGNDTVYIEAGDGAKDTTTSTIYLGNGNNQAFVSGGSNYNIYSFENLSKIGKSTLNVSDGKNHDLFIGGGDTVNISGGNIISVESGLRTVSDVDAFDADTVNITGGKNHSITGKLMNVTIGNKGATTQPDYVFVRLSKHSKDVVKINGGTNHRIFDSGSVSVFDGEVITINSAKKATIDGGNRITVCDTPNVLVKSGTNITINENDTKSRDDTVTIAGGTGNKAYGGCGTNVLTISGGSNNYIKGGVEKDYNYRYEGFDTVSITGGSNNTAEKGYGNVNFYLENGKNNKVLADTNYRFLEQNIRVNGGKEHTITGGNSAENLTIYKDSKATGNPTKIIANLGNNNDVATIKAGVCNVVYGEGENDTLVLNNGTSNKLYGGDGSDIITITGGDKNTAYGGAGGDILTISGGTQNVISSGIASLDRWGEKQVAYDKLYIKGGTKNYAKTTDSEADFINYIYVSGGSGHTMTGGKGTDKLSITGKVTNITANLGTFSGKTRDTINLNTVQNTVLNITGGTKTAVNAGKSSYVNTIAVKGGSGINVTGGKKADVLTISGGKSNTVYGAGGNDKLTVSGGKSQTLKGGKGSDTYTISLSYSKLKNKKLSFTIDQSGDTTKASKDKLVLSGLKSSQVSKKLGNNKKDLKLYIGTGKAASVITIKNWKTNKLASISYGKDKKSIKGGTGNDKITISKNYRNAVIHGNAGNDIITVTGGSNNIIYGDSGKDTFAIGKNSSGNAIIKDYTEWKDILQINGSTITGTKVSGKSIVFTAGKSSLTLEKAFDKTICIKDNRGRYTVSSSEIVLCDDFSGTMDATKFLPSVTMIDGSDAVKKVNITGNSNNNIIFAGKNGGTLKGNAGDDKLYGSDVKDVIYGGKEDDILAGRQGNDILYGGAGNDEFVYENGDGNDIVKDYTEQQDVIEIIGGSIITGTTINNGDIVFSIGKGGITLENSAGKTIEVVDGNGGYTISNTTIKLKGYYTGTMNAGSYMSSVITIDGRNASKTVNIKGNSKNNIIYAGQAGGTYQGGLGNNSLYGGTGSDIFCFDSNSKGNNTIYDYKVGLDVIKFDNGISISSSTVIEDSNVLLKLSTGGTIIIDNAAGKGITFDYGNSSMKTEYFS